MAVVRHLKDKLFMQSSIKDIDPVQGLVFLDQSYWLVPFWDTIIDSSKMGNVVWRIKRCAEILPILWKEFVVLIDWLCD